MAILNPIKVVGRIECLLVNNDSVDLTTVALETVTVDFGGLAGDSHGGLTRESCTRVKQQYKPGTTIRNTRQVSIVSESELEQIATVMGVEKLQPEWLGANLLISGIPNLSALPPSSRLIFENGVSLVVDMENAPCRFPGDIIERHHPGMRHVFAKAAVNLRGVTAWVEREGALATGESVQVHVPTARPYEY